MMRWVFVAALLATPAVAQDETLADIRAQLSVLYQDINALRGELQPTGAANSAATGNSALERLDQIEAQVQRLTSKTEQLEFRLNRITVDGTNRIGDLEFRLCDLEEACDISLLGETPSLGGVDNDAEVPTAEPAPSHGGPALAVGEQADFERAQEALAAGDFRSAADLLASFSQTYPGSPVGAAAALMRGKALDELGQGTEAARAYLESFSSNAEGSDAPEALFRLGRSLAALGQTQDGCVTLAEVGVRFPGSPFVEQAQGVMAQMGCS